MTDITIRKLNSLYIKIDAEPSIIEELSEKFTFEVAGAKFSPKVRKGFWDGRIRLFNKRDRTLFYGLYQEIEEYAKENRFSLEKIFPEVQTFPKEDFHKKIGLPSKYEVRDYQLQAFNKCIDSDGRQLLLSPTNSGKSLIIYMLHRFYNSSNNKKTLIVVPTISLVNQMIGDFNDYGYDTTKMYGIKGGVDKEIPDDIQCVVSTNHSLRNQDETWFSQFNFIVGDEAHTFAAKTLQELMLKTINIPNKIGCTGTY